MPKRDLKNGLAFVRNAGDVGYSQTLTAGSGSGAGSELDISTYAQGDCMHDGILTFDGIFNEPSNSVVKLTSVIVNEYSTTSLSKMDIKLLLFNDYKDFDAVKNSAFSFSTELELKDVIAVVDINSASYDDLDSEHSRCVTDINTDIKLRNASNKTNVYGVMVYNSGTGKAYSQYTELAVALVYDVN